MRRDTPQHRNALSPPPKVAFFDIETAPYLAWVWEKYETNVIEFERSNYMLCFSYKWLGSPKVYTFSLADFPGYRKDMRNDKALVVELWKLMSEADIIVAHNGDNFDIKKSNERFIVHGLPPPPNSKTVDTLKLARRNFKFASNKLDDIAKDLSLGRKLPHTGFHLWKGCMNGDAAAWALMKKYNRQDVVLLERVYLRFRPWAKNHPNVAIYQAIDACPNCGGKRQKRGYTFSQSRKKHRLQCVECGAWSTGDTIKV
jgi:DNA polymerase elongation subunit (family B)